MSVEVLSASRPEAIKVHHCDECNQSIEPGTTYQRQVNVIDREFYVYMAHVECFDFAVTVLGTDDQSVLCEDLDYALGHNPPLIVRERLEAGRK